MTTSHDTSPRAAPAQPSAQAQAAPAVAAVLNEVRWWDHRGDTVEEHYDEIHGAGAFERVVALAAQPSAAAREFTDIEIDQFAADQALQMHVSGGYVLTVPMLRKIIERAHGIAAQAAAKGKGQPSLQRCQPCIDRHDGFYGSYAPPCPVHDDDGNLRAATQGDAK